VSSHLVALRMMSPKGKQVDMVVQQNLLVIGIVSFGRCSNNLLVVDECILSWMPE
jgi:hypothetical protein